MLHFNAEHFLICASAFFFPPILFIVLTIIVFATFGKSFGIRQKYIAFLIKTFEWGAAQVEDASESGTIKSGVFLKENTGECQPQQVTTTTAVSAGGATATDREKCIIYREATIPSESGNYEMNVTSKGWAMIRDSTEFLMAGIEAIIEDQVTSRFKAEELATWNMLTRTRMPFYRSTNWKLTLLWALGFLVRYTVLFPLRFILFVVGFIFLLVSTAAIGVLPDGGVKRNLNAKCMLLCHRILSRSFTTVVHFHNRENRACSGGICVANHTSPIDVLILGLDNVYALVGQRHTGLLGATQRALSRSSSHIWFERSESKDRALVAARLKEHVSDPTKLPILIFPEGTCINNTSVMMFKKGCFEAGATIWPIAMKYDPLFGDAFWNSSEQGWCEYLLRMMTSWAIICNVWYLPPMTRKPGESGVDFANRVKREIAVRGGLVELEWDGGLKRTRVPKKMVAHQQERYAKRLSRYKSYSETDTKGDNRATELRFSNSDSGSSALGLDELPEGRMMGESVFEGSDNLASKEVLAANWARNHEVGSLEDDAESGIRDLLSNSSTLPSCDDEVFNVDANETSRYAQQKYKELNISSVAGMPT